MQLIALKQHQENIASELARCNPMAKALFAFFCAERLRGCCWAYQIGKGVDCPDFPFQCDFLFDLLVSRSTPNKKIVQEIISEINANMPEGGDPLCVQAQSGMICLLAAFDMLINGGQTVIADVIKATIDALHNYDFYINSRVNNKMPSLINWDVIQQEMNRQIMDMTFSKNYERLDPHALTDYRIKNLRHAIPQAL